MDKIQGVGFRDRFQHFFEVLAEKIRTLPVDTQKKSLNSMEILQTVVDQLGALSSMAVVNIRDAVTEAALSIAEGVLRGCGELKDQISVAQRQIAGLEAAGEHKSAKANPKHAAVMKQRDQATKV